MFNAEKHHMWKGGIKINHGYKYIYSPEHPYNNDKYVYEHRLVMEKHKGRVLTPNERVHHINGNKKDNRIENLMLYSSHSEHMSKCKHCDRDKLGRFSPNKKKGERR